jgi:anion-transporting  ArsA/GET3 family ATPase
VRLLTVDPARRLEALMERLGDLPQHSGLSVARLDVAGLMRQLVEMESPDAETRDTILGSRFLPYLTDHIPALHEYLAADLILRDVESGAFDDVVVDTPPFAFAAHFLDAPQRLERLARGMAALSRIRGESPLLARGMSYFLGRSFLGELVSFLGAFDRLWSVLALRSARATEVFSRRTRYVLVLIPESACLEETRSFLRGAPDWQRPELVMVNRVLDAGSGIPEPEMPEKELSSQGTPLGDRGDQMGPSCREASHLLALARAMSAQEHAMVSDVLREWSLAAEQLVRIPLRTTGISDEATLADLTDVLALQLDSGGFARGTGQGTGFSLVRESTP